MLPDFYPVPWRHLGRIAGLMTETLERVSASRCSTVPIFHRAVRNAAVHALIGELVAYPKPGLVSLVDEGSHSDMDARMFLRSSLALRRYFETMVASGSDAAPFSTLVRHGRSAETCMLQVTGGVNTHRGAIFNLGLLAAAAGLRGQGKGPALGTLVRQTWGAGIAVHRREADSHGTRVTRLYGAGGAQSEAAGGFASVYRIALPALRGVLRRGGTVNAAKVQALFALMAQVLDTNLLHRGGQEGLAHAQQSARIFLHGGGVDNPGWETRAVQVHHDFVSRRLSPGGSADLLAACLFIDAIDDPRTVDA